MDDILLDINNDLAFETGDFLTGDATIQNQKLLLQTFKGDWRERPDIGVGIAQYLNDENDDSLLAEIKEQFERDGMMLKSLSINDGVIKTDAYYP